MIITNWFYTNISIKKSLWKMAFVVFAIKIEKNKNISIIMFLYIKEIS